MSTPNPKPEIKTYHCLCTTLLLTTTHTLSTLPTRKISQDNAIILPLPYSPPPNPNPDSNPNGNKNDLSLPPTGFTTLLSLTRDRRTTLTRLSDGFEKRAIYRCDRCKLVIGYELVKEGTRSQLSVAADEYLRGRADGTGKGDTRMDIDVDMDVPVVDFDEGYRGKVIYLLPGGLVGTGFMVGMGGEKGRRIGEGDVEVGGGGVVVFE